MLTKYFMTVVSLSLLHQSTCWSYCIISEDVEANSFCITLNEFARSAYNLDPEVALVFQPGKHTLSIGISVFNISEFRISTLQSANTTILCENQARLVVNKVRNVSISDTTFIGCGGNLFIAVDNLLIDNSTFTGSEESLIALEFYDIKSALITRTVFSSNHKSRYEVGSTIIVSGSSTVSINYCEFCNNSNQVGAIFVDMESIITITNCDFVDNRGGIIFANSSSVFISSSTFSNNVNMLTSMLITILAGDAEIVMTNFTNNSQVLTASFTIITINQCTFYYNYIPGFMSTTSLGIEYGGIIVANSSTVTMKNCLFLENDATKFGGIIVLIFGKFMSHNRLELVHNQAMEGALVLIKNNATLTGNVSFENNEGSLLILESSVEFHSPGSFIIFQNNTPSSRVNDTIRGGAITAYYSSVTFREDSDVMLINNTAVNGAGICAVVSVLYITAQMNIASNTAKDYGGGIFLYQSEMNVYSEISITNNTARFGGGIYEVNSYILVISVVVSSDHNYNLSLTDNQATLGGGLYLSSSSQFYIYNFNNQSHSINIVLTSNSADYGGAIYVRDETYPLVCEADNESNLSPVFECFLQVADQHSETGSLGLHFYLNKATKAGPVLYGGLLDRCTVTHLASSFFKPDSIFTEMTGINYFKSVSNIGSMELIASNPVRICFCFDSKPNCSVKSLPVQTQKDRTFNVSISAFDHVGHPRKALILAEIDSSTGSLGEGQQSQEIDDQCTLLSFSVTSVASNETIAIYADGPCGNAGQSTRMIAVEFTECDCPIGFDVNYQKKSICECICSDNMAIKNLIHNCTIETESFKKVENFWIGYENTKDTAGIIFSRICPLDYCRPIENVQINLNIPNGADVQCANNRGGRLCGRCKPQYSLYYGHSGCVKCESFWPFTTAILALISILSGMVLIPLLLFLNLTVTTGTINGLIFSANMLSAIHPFPEQDYATFIISLLNMKIGLNVCFYEGYNSYIGTWLQLEYPIFLILLILMVIVASNCSSEFAKFIGKRNPVETLATLLFLTYTKLFQFVIAALSSADIEHSNNTTEKVWLLDGTINYYEIRHIIMLIAAIVILCFVSGYTFLLLFWQWLVKLSSWKICASIGNTRFKTLIEMYHVPFNSTHRYWTGLLLLIRIIVYLVAALTSSSESGTEVHFTIISLLAVLLVIKGLTVRVYKKWLVDALESVMITLTMLATGCNWYTVKTRKNLATYAALFTMNLTMVVVFIGIVVYHINRYVLKKKLNTPKRLRGIGQSLCQRFQSEVCNDNRNQQEETPTVTIDHPTNLNYLNVDRFGSLLRVMGSPTENDYRQLRLQQQMLEEEINNQDHEDDREQLPVPPTSSSLPRLHELQ